MTDGFCIQSAIDAESESILIVHRRKVMKMVRHAGRKNDPQTFEYLICGPSNDFTLLSGWIWLHGVLD